MTKSVFRLVLGGGASVLGVLALWGCHPRLVSQPPPPVPLAKVKLKPAHKGDKYWESAKEQVYKRTSEVLKQRQHELAVGLRFHVLDHGDPRRKWLALTFDDGPHPAYTPKLLAILKQYNVRATFFLVGKMAEQYPDLVRAEMAAGHELGNHTYHHVNLLEIPVGAVATEIKACGEVIQGITGQAPGLFRPPGGDYDKRVAETAESLGYTMVLWTDDPADYASPGVKLVTSRVLCDLSDGGIVLLHDGVQQTVDLLAPLLAVLKAKGYEFVTADEMLPQRATPAPRPGKS